MYNRSRYCSVECRENPVLKPLQTTGILNQPLVLKEAILRIRK